MFDVHSLPGLTPRSIDCRPFGAECSMFEVECSTFDVRCSVFTPYFPLPRPQLRENIEYRTPNSECRSCFALAYFTSTFNIRYSAVRYSLFSCLLPTPHSLPQQLPAYPLIPQKNILKILNPDRFIYGMGLIFPSRPVSDD